MPKTATKSLFEVLRDHAGVRGIFGEGAGFRCFTTEAPPGMGYPLLVIRKLGTDPVISHAQGTGDDARLDEGDYDFTVIAATQEDADAGMYQARLAVEESEGLKGAMTGERHLTRAAEAKAFGTSADVQIWHDPDSD